MRAFIFIPWLPNFLLYILYSVNFGIQNLTRCDLFQDTISTQIKNMLTKLHENQEPVTYFFNLL